MRRTTGGVIATLFLSVLLAACGHEHTWVAATCTEPATCSKCGETDGEPLGHTWSEATCTAPKTCSVCGEVEGEALGHDWEPATHEAPETCRRCGETRGTPLLFDIPPGFAGDYAFGLFEAYNTPAEENGLGDTMIWFNATYDAVSTIDMPDVKPGMQAFVALAKDEGGNTWVLQLDWNEYEPIDKFVAMQGHQLCIAGMYLGYSEVYQAPAVLVEKVFDRMTGDIVYSTWFSDAF